MAKFDLIIYGASGFTGSLAAKYLQSIAAKQGTKWAVAGRSQSKLEAVLREIGGDKIPIIIADSSDEAALRSLVKQTKVIISLVGPYAIYGTKLVKVCAEEGVHYCDLTGEAPFCYKMINEHGRTAIENKAIIVHSAGFDSIPSDLTTFLAVQRLKKIPGAEVGEVKAIFSAKGGASGGTIASALAMFNDGTPEDMKVLRNPFCLSPIRANHAPRNVILGAVSFRQKKTWGGFFVMAPHNSAIVRRTWGILEQAPASSSVQSYGPKFEYEELMKTPGPISAIITSLILYVSFMSLALFQPARWALERFGPKPGEGPSIEVQQTGWFKTETTATSVDKQNQVQVVMKGNIDPGYSGTARMIVECGLALAHDYERLPPLAKKGGFLTPATAFGEVLVERLIASGTFSFDLQSDKKE